MTELTLPATSNAPMSRHVRNRGEAGRSSWAPSRRITNHDTAVSGRSRINAPRAGSIDGAATRSVMLTTV